MSTTPSHAAKIGPNAVLQLTQALTAAGLDDAMTAIFAEAGASDWLAQPPAEMIDEKRVAAIHQAVRRLLPPDRARAVLTDAGLRTGDYILANRIPKFAQVILMLLPAPLAARMLVKAISKHSWTFAGTGRFSAKVGRQVEFEIAGNPIVAGERADTMVCVWHAAVFERLFDMLVSPKARAFEVACSARGDAACRFVVDWTGTAAQPGCCGGHGASGESCCGGHASKDAGCGCGCSDGGLTSGNDAGAKPSIS